MTIDSRKLTAANLVYCYIPVVLFLAGWCRWIISIPCLLLLGFLFYRLYTRKDRLEAASPVSIDRKLLIGIGVVSAIMALIFGYGGIFAEFNDYEKHAAMVQDLSRHSWPVIYDDAASPSMMTYYIGSYLFPGLIGKIFSSRIVAELALGVVGWLGMLLLFANILHLTQAATRKQQIGALTVYLLFIGMLLPLQLLTHRFNPDVTIGYPHWFTYQWLQYRSSMVCLKWIWPQYFIPILGMIMLYQQRDARHLYAVWVLPALLCGTWGFVTLMGYIAAYYLISCLRDKKIHWDILSWQNVVCGVIGVLVLIYLAGGLGTEKPDELQFRFISDWKYYLISYIPFCLFMFGFYFMLIWKGSNRDAFFYITLGLLCVIPFFRAGLFNDWTMGTSMPAYFMLCIYCIRFLLQQASVQAMRKRWIALLICLSLSVPFPLYEWYNTFRYSGIPAKTLADYSCLECEDIAIDLRTNYFTYDYQESLFYKYIARR